MTLALHKGAELIGIEGCMCLTGGVQYDMYV